MREGRTRLGMRWNRLKVAAGSTSGGFFIPYGYARHLKPPASPYTAIETGPRPARDALEPPDGGVRPAPATAEHPLRLRPRPRAWGQSMLPAFDGAAAYTLVRQIRPPRALRDGGIDCAFTCIPAPRGPGAPPRHLPALGLSAGDAALVLLGAERADRLDRVGLLRGGVSRPLRAANRRRPRRDAPRPALRAAGAIRCRGASGSAAGRSGTGRDSRRATRPGGPRPPPDRGRRRGRRPREAPSARAPG